MKRRNTLAQSSEEQRVKRRLWYEANKERVLADCKRWRTVNRDRWMFTRREHRRKLREAVLTKFGNKCNICGFTNPKALQIDHVNGNGKMDRKQYSNGALPSYLKKVLQDKEGMYQLLCANCNLIKYWSDPSTKHGLIETIHQRIKSPVSKTNSNQKQSNTQRSNND